MQSRFVLLRCTTQLLMLSGGSHFRAAFGFSPASTTIAKRGAAFFSSSSTSSLNAAPATLSFGNEIESNVNSFNSTVIIGKKESLEDIVKSSDGDLLKSLQIDSIQKAVLNAMVSAVDNKTGGSVSTMIATTSEDDGDDDDDDSVHKVALGGLPTKISRHNHPMAVHKLTQMASSQSKGNTRIVVLTDDFAIGPLASAIAKAFPLFSMKTNNGKKKNNDKPPRNIHVVFIKKDGSVVTDQEELTAASVVADGVRLAGRLVDSHPELLTTTQFAKEVQSLVENHPQVKMTQLIGKDLVKYGGLYGVGKGANCPPRMVILEYDGGDDASETVALVGKGIVFDTGGLSLKPKTGMCGMKHDMGGAAGMFGGFWSAVQLGVKKKVYCILCLAENAIGPDSFRNDDILDMYSGKTVEVNNCDAEGRLVLGDGVAHATKHFDNLDLVVDMATLTGAQLIATGKKHAGILANKEEVEDRAMKCGMHSGDMCFPLLYAPELLMDEFKSEVADMKNSVKDRGNAQTSCAGHFIEAHLDADYDGGWLHVDMAGPGTNGARGTGYGVGLVLSLLEAPGF